MQFIFKDKERFKVEKYRKRYTITFYQKKAGVAIVNSHIY